MTNLEHYFENLLFDGKDVNGDCNKKELTAAEQAAVNVCAEYVIYTLFNSREEFLSFIEEKRKRLTQNKWEIYEYYAKKLEEILAED